MKLSCCTWSYHRSLEAKKIDLEGLLNICAKKLRLGGVDIIADHLPKTDKRYLAGLKKFATDLQLTIACLSPGNNFGLVSKAARDSEVKKIKEWIDVGLILGAPVLRIFAGWPPKDKKNELWKPMVECIETCAKYAQESGITLAIEPHNDGGFLPTSVETLRLINEINSPWVRLNLDTGNYQDKDMYAALEKSIGYAPHIHAKIHKLSAQGEELEFDYNRIFEILKRNQYRGFISVEYEGQEDELEYVPKAVDMLRRYGAKYNMCL